MTASVFEQVQQIAADIFTMPLEEVRLESSPDTIENWDSLQHLNLVLTLEESFALEFTPEEIEHMHSVESITTLVQEKVAQIA